MHEINNGLELFISDEALSFSFGTNILLQYSICMGIFAEFKYAFRVAASKLFLGKAVAKG